MQREHTAKNPQKELRLALIGKDVSRSKSEEMHRFILSRWGRTCDYRTFSVGAAEFDETAEKLLRETDGFNVTIPYKLAILPHLKGVRGDAAEFGAVNTVCSAEKLGFNTDGAGFMLMLEAAGVSVADKTALVLGAGGAGRSTAAVLKNAGARVYLYCRHADALKKAADELGVRAADSPDGAFDLAVNCTGVGMHDSEGKSPVPASAADQYGAAVDLIYNPEETEFLRAARLRGKPTLGGTAMLFYQAYYADCIYLGKMPSRDEAAAFYAEYLKKRSVG